MHSTGTGAGNCPYSGIGDVREYGVGFPTQIINMGVVF